jgi:hypothetical protein
MEALYELLDEIRLRAKEEILPRGPLRVLWFEHEEHLTGVQSGVGPVEMP